jgi:hypothetical protein
MVYVWGYSIKIGINVFFIISLVNNKILIFRDIMNNELYVSERGFHSEDGSSFLPIF